jgi:putative aldouronate transport system permease protein
MVVRKVGLKPGRQWSATAFEWGNAICLIILTLTCAFPFIHMAAISVSDADAINRGMVSVFPRGFQIDAYEKILREGSMLRSLLYTVLLTIVFTAVAMMLTILAAYPLSKKRLKGRTPILVFIVFTMFFNGGLIPTYIVIQKLGLIDNFWVLVLPGAITTWNFLVLKTFFGAVPESLEESAVIDGANAWHVLTKILLPLSLPALVTISLFYAVWRWNHFTDALFYVNSPELKPLSLTLNQLLSYNVSRLMEVGQTNPQMEMETVLPESLKAASLVFTMVPILLVYPWLQKYFVKGVMIGSIKG